MGQVTPQGANSVARAFQSHLVELDGSIRPAAVAEELKVPTAGRRSRRGCSNKKQRRHHPTHVHCCVLKCYVNCEPLVFCFVGRSGKRCGTDARWTSAPTLTGLSLRAHELCQQLENSGNFTLTSYQQPLSSPRRPIRRLYSPVIQLSDCLPVLNVQLMS